MSNTYYTSLTGMLAASYGIQNTSHNIANMQSPGFKRSEVYFSSLSDEKNSQNSGSGVNITGKNTNFSAGNYLETGNPTDLAIVGQGFFIVRLKNNELVYTRDGEFFFNNEGMLSDRRTGGLVQGYNEQGELIPIQQFVSKTHTGKATHSIDLAGEFILLEKKENDNFDPDPRKSNYENIQFSVANVFDEEGKEHQIELTFKPQGAINVTQKNWDGLEWDLLKVSYDGNNLNFTPQTLKFSDQLNGTALENFNQIAIRLPNNQAVTFRFGNYMSDQDKSVRLNKADQSKTNANLTIAQQDGYREGKASNFSFDENGQISYQYDNGQSTDGVYIALAKFTDLDNSLIPINDNLFRAKGMHSSQVGRANTNGFGSLQPQKIESANVDSTTEFAHIVILQRMFQACSQIMEIDKQLLEELAKK